MKTACFTGHRPPKINEKNTAAVRSALEKTVRALASDGCLAFISGMALGTDMLAAETVLALKNEFPGMTLECALPCRGQTLKWTAAEKRRHAAILARADKVTVLSERYTPFCMQMRNVYMVDSSDTVIAVFDGSAGGTANTVDYARRRGRDIIFLSPGGDDDG